MKTEKIPFDFSLWGQEGIEVWHNDGRKAVYVGTTAMPFYLFHWDDGSFSESAGTDWVYMIRQAKQKSLMEVIEDSYNEADKLIAPYRCGVPSYWGSLPEHIMQCYTKFANEVINRAKEEGLI